MEEFQLKIRRYSQRIITFLPVGSTLKHQFRNTLCGSWSQRLESTESGKVLSSDFLFPLHCVGPCRSWSQAQNTEQHASSILVLTSHHLSQSLWQAHPVNVLLIFKLSITFFKCLASILSVFLVVRYITFIRFIANISHFSLSGLSSTLYLPTSFFSCHTLSAKLLHADCSYPLSILLVVDISEALQIKWPTGHGS